MGKLVKSILVGVILIAIIWSIGCSSSSTAPKEQGAVSPSASISPISKPTNGLVQSNDEGTVVIDVEWIGAEDAQLIFDVAMNTHSVDLDQYNLGKLALLRDDKDNKYNPVSWNSSPGGHHREGRLTFPLPDSLSQEKTKYVEIVIRDVAGIKERILRWAL